MLTETNSYVTLAEADTYHLERMSPGWASAEELVRTAACIRATDYIALNYTLAEDVTTAHAQVKRATLALSALALNSTLAEASSAPVLSEEGTGIGKITYGDAPSDPFHVVTAILRGVATRNGGGSGGGPQFLAARALI